MSEKEINERLAEEICTGVASNGKHFRAGDWVALLDGKVVAITPELDGALRALRALEPNPSRGMVFEVGPPLVDVIR